MRSEDEETFLHGAQTKTAFRIDLEVRARRNTMRWRTAYDAAMGVGDGARSAAIAGGDESLALLAAPEAEQFIEPARQLLNASPNIGGVSFVNDVLISRLIAPDSQQLRASLIPLITLLRSGRDMPRAWQI